MADDPANPTRPAEPEKKDSSFWDVLKAVPSFLKTFIKIAWKENTRPMRTAEEVRKAGQAAVLKHIDSAADSVERILKCNPQELFLPPMVLMSDPNLPQPSEQEILQGIAQAAFKTGKMEIVTAENHPKLFEAYQRQMAEIGTLSPPPLLVWADSKVENALHLTYAVKGQKRTAVFFSSAFEGKEYSQKERDFILGHELFHHRLCELDKQDIICGSRSFDAVRINEIYSDAGSRQINGSEALEKLLRRGAPLSAEVRDYIDYCDPHYSNPTRSENFQVMDMAKAVVGIDVPAEIIKAVEGYVQNPQNASEVSAPSGSKRPPRNPTPD